MAICWSFWYIFSRFGMLQQEKSGNPGPGSFDFILFAHHSTTEPQRLHVTKKRRGGIGGQRREKVRIKR
jgi:hypothetical protein